MRDVPGVIPTGETDILSHDGGPLEADWLHAKREPNASIFGRTLMPLPQ